jgi:hypothetical protein
MTRGAPLREKREEETTLNMKKDFSECRAGMKKEESRDLSKQMPNQ